ncbi:MAG: hypothetical protein JHC88_09140 [Niveispirillum sp.]|nr:hypothetical protein [Niveispirillum sp.]
MSVRYLSLIGLALALTACAQTPAPEPTATPPPQPTSVDNGLGSQFGNYENYETGSTHQNPSGPCPIYAWDRPISGGRVIRYLSAACPAPQPGRPDAVRIIDLGRQVITP